MDNFKGIWIPSNIWLDKTLTLQEKIFLSYWEELKTFSNKELSDFFDLTPRHCSRIKNSLIEKGKIEKNKTLTYEEIKEEVLKKKGRRKCSWCGCHTSTLHEHHFPIPKRDGGTEIVKICPNCHSEFHTLEQLGGENDD